MLVQFYSINNYHQRNTAFSSRGKGTAKLQNNLQGNLQQYIKNNPEKPEAIRTLYNTGIDFLSNKIDKETYIKLLDKNLREIYNTNSSAKSISKRIPLTQKEEEFFDDMFTTLDLSYSKKAIPEEKLRRALKQLGLSPKK